MPRSKSKRSTSKNKSKKSKKSKKTNSKQLFVLEKGTLSKFGYHDVKNISQQTRRAALNKALNKLPPLTVFRKINALKVLNKNVDKELAQMFQSDIDWIKNTKQYANRKSKSKSKKRINRSKSKSKKRINRSKSRRTK
jgi:hypothetical protein